MFSDSSQASQEGRFGFKVHVKEAHRLIPISPEDWHLLACWSERGKFVYVNTTGTFGVASAAYWWSRLTTAAISGAHCVLGRELSAWLLPVADDLAMLFHKGKMQESVLLVCGSRASHSPGRNSPGEKSCSGWGTSCS